MNIPKIKILLLGESNVGKSCLFQHFIKEEPPYFDNSTLGTDVGRKSLILNNGQKVNLEIWDTAGQERFRTLVARHYRLAERVMIIYDVCSMKSFEEVGTWLREVYKHTNLNREHIFLVGNKNDLDLREVPPELGMEWANNYGINFRELSAMNYTEVEELFIDLVENCQLPSPILQDNSVNLKQYKPKRHICCKLG